MNSEFDLRGYLDKRRDTVDTALDTSIPLGRPEKLYEAIRYSLLIGGKRVRPILCLAACEVAGGTVEMALPTACALEMLHTMSLIHDDLPAMDDDDLRRGQPSNHKVYGEAIAILAGDALWPYAFEWIAAETKGVPADRVVGVVRLIGHATGAAGLIGGQVLDIMHEGDPDIDADMLEYIHRNKTGALMQVCLTSGATLGGADSDTFERLSEYGALVGMAFQIADDILDVTATSEQLGKTAHKDEATDKITYPRLWGLDESRRRANELADGAVDTLSPFGPVADPLRMLARYIVARTN